ncbi:MAG: hypothetical protein H6Q62_335, partial [Firmicutes bacterium]|nr:hypothetical protein [Bacillota bacterium]
MIGSQGRTGGWGQTLAIFADLAFFLFGTAGFEEIGGRTAEVVDIAFEIGVMDQDTGFLENGSVAAPGHDPTMMEGDRTKIATAITATMAVDRKTNFIDSGHTALALVNRVRQPFIRQGVNPVQFTRRQRLLGRVLDQVTIAVALNQGLAGAGILFEILQPKSDCVGEGIFGDLRITWQL